MTILLSCKSTSSSSSEVKESTVYATHSLLLPVFESRTYVVSQLEVFLARQLIVHSFDQLQDLQGRKKGKKEMSCWRMSDCWSSHKERRLAAPSASSSCWKGEGLSELRTKATLQDDQWGLLWPAWERLGQGSCRVSFTRQSRSADARPPIKRIANAAGRLSEQLKDETQGLATFTRSQTHESNVDCLLLFI